MIYPINVDRFVEICLKALDEYDDSDRKWAHAIATALNRAYYKGLEDGKKTK